MFAGVHSQCGVLRSWLLYEPQSGGREAQAHACSGSPASDVEGPACHGGAHTTRAPSAGSLAYSTDGWR